MGLERCVAVFLEVGKSFLVNIQQNVCPHLLIFKPHFTRMWYIYVFFYYTNFSPDFENSEYHSKGGPLYITKPDPTPVTEAWLQAGMGMYRA